MSAAIRPHDRHQPLGLVVSYRLSDGSDIPVGVTPEVAAVLAEPEPELRETTFTDLGAKGKPREVDVRAVDWLSFELRAYYRHLRTARVTDSPWEGPRIEFERFIGDSRIWRGPGEINGHCHWHGARLPADTYCLGCDRCGIESLIPRPSKEDVRRCRLAEEERKKDGGKAKNGGGRRLKGGRG